MVLEARERFGRGGGPDVVVFVLDVCEPWGECGCVEIVAANDCYDRGGETVLLSLRVDIFGGIETRVDRLKDACCLFLCELRILGERGEKIGSVGGGVDPVELRVVSTEITLVDQIRRRFRDEAVIAVDA